MRLSYFALVSALIPALACSQPKKWATAENPNVVLIIIDTLRADKLSSYGHAEDPSPALSRLTENGVQFDSVYAQASWTLPSASSMLTSQYPRTIGIYGVNSGSLPDRFTTLAEALKAAGYTTFGATANPNLNTIANFQQGFDEYLDSNLFPERKGKKGQPTNKISSGPALRTAPELFQDAVDFIDATNNVQPYFLQFDVMEVHEHNFPELLRSEYADGFEESEDAAYLRRIRQVTDDIEGFVGRLRELEGWEHTLFVITSDHGEGLKDHPGVERAHAHGWQLYDSQLRVPLLIFNESWMIEPKRISQSVRLLDLLPTVLELAGTPPPLGIEGISLVPLMTGAVEEIEFPDALITETHFRGANKISIHAREWQYIHNREKQAVGQPHELQHRDQVPNGPATDVSNQYPKVLKALQGKIAAWERAHPENPSTVQTEELSESELEQLEAIGYMGDE